MQRRSRAFCAWLLALQMHGDIAADDVRKLVHGSVSLADLDR